MRYYSETTKKFYDTEKEALAAEKEFAVKQEEAKKAEEAKNAEKKARAEEVENAYKLYIDAQKAVDNYYKEYLEKRKAFVRDFGYFHQSYRDEDNNVLTISDIFESFFRF